MTKTISDKGFLKNEAVSGLSYVVLKWNEGAFEELCSQTESNNGLIS